MSERTRYGGDYNPEQWPPSVWREDVRLMGDAGVDLVTVGVFSWAELEPAEGTFSFGWLREVLDLLGEAGIGVDLATPTASPPPWLTTRYPDVLPVDATGARYSHGSREHFCVCNPNYRQMARRIVERLAAEVGDHPAIEMWHLSNEYACHVPYCYCDHHAVAFRQWLERRYGSVAALNEAWGTSFWSQRYGDFAEVLPPRMMPTFGNPAQDLDFRRFSSDAFLEEALEERAIVKNCRPELPVTTNFMGFFKPLDYFDWASKLDVACTDNYTDPSVAGVGHAKRNALRPGPFGKQGYSVDGHGADELQSELAAAQRGQGPRANAGYELPGCRSRRHRVALFPVARFTCRGRKVPFGHAFPLRRGFAGMEGSDRARA